MNENIYLTPPQIVAGSEDRAHSLRAFIAQELEQWGFDVLDLEPLGSGLAINMPDDLPIIVRIEAVR